MWETIGPIADRSDEILGASDLAIVEFRRQMVEAANIFKSGGSAIGAQQPRIPQSRLHSFEGVVDKGLDWKTLGASDEELAFNEANKINTTAAE